ncbi:hypothetical protein EPO56_01190 [Patescibacteria group bacterium]|nr:MAG: hypothetical protein EPO56_01190 [Patescibacteria group bacterium]
MKTSWLKWGIIAGIFGVFCIPLFVANPLFFPFITGKGFAFRILVEILVALWLVLMLADPSARPRFSLKQRGTWIFIALSLFVLSLGVSDIWSANPHKSFWSNFERMEGWIGLIHLYAFFVVLWSTIRDVKDWRMIFEVAIGVSVIEGLYGLLQLAGSLPINQGGVRVDGTFGNATYLAVYMLFMAFFTALAYHWWGKGKTKIRWWYGAAFVLQLIMIFYTATRGTILGLFGGAVLTVLIILFFGERTKQVRKWSVGVLIALAVLGGGFFLAKDTAFIQSNDVLTRIANISLSEGSTRFTIWNMAWQGFQERPIFGWGQESFNHVFNKYYEPSMYAQEPWFDRAHNEYLDWLVAGGSVGFLLYLSLFALALWFLWRPKSAFTVTERALFTGLLAGYGFHNLFVFDNLLSYILFFTLLAYIAFREESNDASHGDENSWWRHKASPSVIAMGAPILVSIMVIVFYFANVSGIATAYNLIEALKPHEKGIEENVRYIKLASETTGLGRQEAREQLVQFAVQAKNASIGDEAFRSSVEGYAIQQMSDEISRNPNDTRLRLFLGTFLRQAGRYEESKNQFDAALLLSPKKQQIYFELGILETLRGNKEKALELFKTAFELDQGYDTARLYYAAALTRSGNKALSDTLLIEKFQTTAPDNDVLLQAYLDVRDYDAVIAIAKSRVVNDPKNVKKIVQLAAIYLEAGRRTEAIAALQQAIEADASFKAQGEYYIQEIASGKNP